MSSLPVAARPVRPRRARLDTSARIVLGLTVAFAAYLVAAPVAMLLFAALRGPADVLPFEPGARWSLEHIVAAWSDPVVYASVLPQTLVFACSAVVLTFSIAFALAWLVERTDLPGRNAWYGLVLLPLLVPNVMLGIAWVWLFGPNAGWVNVALRALFGLEGPGPVPLFGMPGLVVAQALSNTPFMFLMLTAVLRSMNPALEEASRLSGASPLRSFTRITLPVLAPGLLAPAILSFLVAIEQFEMPLVIGLPAGINVLSTRIFYALTPASGLPDYGGAAATALPFLGLGLGLLGVYNRLIRRAERYATIVGKAFRPARYRLGRWRGPALAMVSLYVAVAALLPTLVLVWVSVAGYAPPSLAALRSASLDSYARLFAAERFHAALGNTLVVASTSACIATTIGGLIAWLLVRRQFRGKFVVDAISFVSIGIPSVIAGLGILVLYVSLPVGVYGTTAILVIAYSYRLTVTTRVARAGIMQLHPELEEAAAVSGARWWRSLRTVTGPLVAPSLVAGFTLLFIVGVREFTLPLLLGSPDNLVLSVVLWRLFEAGHAAESAALGTLMILLVTPVVFALRRLVDSGRERPA